jgi:hypothetical protein
MAAALMISKFARRHIVRQATWGRVIGLTSGGDTSFWVASGSRCSKCVPLLSEGDHAAHTERTRILPGLRAVPRWPDFGVPHGANIRRGRSVLECQACLSGVKT